MNKEFITHQNGILNLNHFREEAKVMTPEKEEAILARNKALSQIPASERKAWVENHPLEMFMPETFEQNCEDIAEIDVIQKNDSLNKETHTVSSKLSLSQQITGAKEKQENDSKKNENGKKEKCVDKELCK